jgi:hypothetical protein
MRAIEPPLNRMVDTHWAQTTNIAALDIQIEPVSSYNQSSALQFVDRHAHGSIS